MGSISGSSVFHLESVVSCFSNHVVPPGSVISMSETASFVAWATTDWGYFRISWHLASVFMKASSTIAEVASHYFYPGTSAHGLLLSSAVVFAHFGNPKS